MSSLCCSPVSLLAQDCAVQYFYYLDSQYQRFLQWQLLILSYFLSLTWQLASEMFYRLHSLFCTSELFKTHGQHISVSSEVQTMMWSATHFDFISTRSYVPGINSKCWDLSFKRWRLVLSCHRRHTKLWEPFPSLESFHSKRINMTLNCAPPVDMMNTTLLGVNIFHQVVENHTLLAKECFVIFSHCLGHQLCTLLLALAFGQSIDTRSSLSIAVYNRGLL